MQTLSRGHRQDLLVVLSRVDRALRRLPEVSVRVGDLARAAGVSPRTLYRAFSRHRGAPPISLLRRSRLEEVRRRLEEPEPGDTVGAVALDLGFSHLGRFASTYRRCFGETPSATLRRARVALSLGPGGAGRGCFAASPPRLSRGARIALDRAS